MYYYLFTISGRDGSKRGKRGDDEDDAELMHERKQALNSLKNAHQIIQHTNFEKVRLRAKFTGPCTWV